MTVPVGLNAPVSVEVSCAWVPSAIGPAGEMRVVTSGAFGLTISGSAAQPLLTGPVLLLSPL